MTFEEYGLSKKINFEVFQKENPNLYTDLKFIFDLVSVASFEQQKLFLINKLRRKYAINS